MRVKRTCRFHHGIACTVRSSSVESDNDFRKVQGPVMFFREASFGAAMVLTVIAAEYRIRESGLQRVWIESSSIEAIGWSTVSGGCSIVDAPCGRIVREQMDRNVPNISGWHRRHLRSMTSDNCIFGDIAGHSMISTYENVVLMVPVLWTGVNSKWCFRR